MVTQSLLWQSEQQSCDFAELCNALYERELCILTSTQPSSIASLQGRIKSLPHYVKRTADALLATNSPLALDIQNASWSATQASNIPSINQLSDYQENVINWYLELLVNKKLLPGLVVPIVIGNNIVLDCVNTIEQEKQSFRTNVYGWFNLNEFESKVRQADFYLLKPTKKVMTAACTGHSWRNGKKTQPVIPSLQALLLSCSINWRNFKQPLAPNEMT